MPEIHIEHVLSLALGYMLVICQYLVLGVKIKNLTENERQSRVPSGCAGQSAGSIAEEMFFCDWPKITYAARWQTSRYRLIDSEYLSIRNFLGFL